MFAVVYAVQLGKRTRRKTMNYPYNDETMEYDYTLHGYVLTKKGVLDFLNTNLDTYLDATGDANPSTMGQLVLKMISQHLYAWIYAHNPRNQKFIEYLLAKYEPCRQLIQDCLVNEVYYNLKNGDFYNYADDEHGFDKKVSETTRLMLSEPLPNGVCLLYQGWRGYPIISKETYRADY